MARIFRIWEQGHPIQALGPAADAAGRTGAYFSLLNAHKAFLLCSVTQGNAAPVTFTPLQATSAAGANSKALTSACAIVANLAVATSDTLALATAATSYTTDAGLNTKLVIFEIVPEESMDINNTTVGPFTYVGVQTSPSNAANITSALLILAPLRYALQTALAANA
jgi:hypothetical protein